MKARKEKTEIGSVSAMIESLARMAILFVCMRVYMRASLPITGFTPSRSIPHLACLF